MTPLQRFLVALPFITFGAVAWNLAIRGCGAKHPPSAPKECGFVDAGSCGGPCPSGEVCKGVGKTGCACRPEAGSPFCGFVDAGTCGGPCPVNQVCARVKESVCACVGPE